MGSVLAMVHGDLRLVRINSVFVLRMSVDPEFRPRMLDGMNVHVCPSGDGQVVVDGALRFHGVVDERRSSVPPAAPTFRRSFALSGGRRILLRHVAVTPMVRAVCAKTIGYQLVLERPLTEDEASEGVVVFCLSGGREQSLRYSSVPLSRP